jgi:hypothetical protein
MIQQWDFPVDEPVSLTGYRRRRVDDTVAIIADRIRTGTSIRALADEFGVSRAAIRRALARTGVVTEVEKEPQPGPPLRHVRAYRLPGRRRSRALTPTEVEEQGSP